MPISLRIGLLLALGSACSTASAPSPARSTTPRANPMLIVPIQEAKFLPVSASLPDGPRMAILWGDPSTGPSAVLLEMKRGAVPLHLHSSDYHLVVLEGTMKHWSAEQSEQQAVALGPGSYWFQPGGQAHGDACLSERCLMQIVWSGPRDGKLAVARSP